MIVFVAMTATIGVMVIVLTLVVRQYEAVRSATHRAEQYAICVGMSLQALRDAQIHPHVDQTTANLLSVTIHDMEENMGKALGRGGPARQFWRPRRLEP